MFKNFINGCLNQGFVCVCVRERERKILNIHRRPIVIYEMGPNPWRGSNLGSLNFNYSGCLYHNIYLLWVLQFDSLSLHHKFCSIYIHDIKVEECKAKQSHYKFITIIDKVNSISKYKHVPMVWEMLFVSIW